MCLCLSIYIILSCVIRTQGFILSLISFACNMILESVLDPYWVTHKWVNCKYSALQTSRSICLDLGVKRVLRSHNDERYGQNSLYK